MFFAVLIWGPFIKAIITPQENAYPKSNPNQTASNQHSDTYWPTVIQAVTATMMLGLVGGQIYIAARQNGIANRQTAIQKAQHIALNRPRIIVREVQKWTNKHDTEGRACIHFCVVNIGASEATPISSIYRSDILSEKRSPFTLYPKTLESGFPENFLGRDAIGPQHVSAFTVPSDAKERDLMTVEARWIKGEKTDDIWVFHGLIVYADGNGTTYRTSFWHVYNFTTRRFVPTEDTDYEHAH
jgi:hypothetical protein